MKFSLVTFACALLSMAPNALAAPVVKAKQLPASQALQLVQALNTVLDGHSAKINHTVSGINAGSSSGEKDAAVKSVGAQMQAMTLAISKTIGEIGTKANTGHLLRSVDTEIEERASSDSAKALAKALQHTLTTLAGTVNTALAVLGLTPLLAFLTPLTGSLSGLVLTLKAVVDSLLPLLNTILDGVVLGLTGLLAGLIL